MEPTIDPATGAPLPADAIQRILFLSPSVHVYNIPPLASNKGHVAASWTADGNKRQIFTARLRILETAIPNPSLPSGESLKTDILLEDPSNGQLFAAAPYTNEIAVEQVLDSSRFFAVRVQGEGGRKAVLGVGFEERSEAFDFSVALQEVRKTLGLGDSGKSGGKRPVKEEKKEEKRDFSLKEGETIVVNIGGAGRRKKSSFGADTQRELSGSTGFSLPPPPGGLGAFLPPPPSASEVKKQKRFSATFEPPNPVIKDQSEISAEDLGFDDGEFGEFQ